MDAESAARKIALNPARGLSGQERLAQLESGAERPSRTQLVEMAKHYHRPLLTFYLPAPPRCGDRGEDFRSLSAAQPRTDNAILDALLRDIRARQGILRAMLEAEEEAAHLPFVGSVKLSDGVDAVASSIAHTLNFSLDQFRRAPSPQAAFSILRDAAEDAGIFVLLKNDLGSHHTSIDVQVFRGFASADPIAPIVVVNGQDAKTALSFTLLHELAHLWLGRSGVSGTDSETAIEQFSNDVASEILLPKGELGHLHLNTHFALEELATMITSFARERNLSSSMVAYKLLRTNAISTSRWRELSDYFRSCWLAEQRKRRERGKEREGGPDANKVAQYRLGNRLIKLTGRMVRSGALSTSKAGILLGVKGKRVEAILRAGGGES